MSRDEGAKAGWSLHLPGIPAHVPDVCQASAERCKVGCPVAASGPPEASIRGTDPPVLHHVRRWKHWDQNPHFPVQDGGGR